MMKALLFDMDGVLVDTVKEHESAFFTVLAQYGIILSHKEYADHFFGKSDDDGFKELFLRYKIQNYDLKRLHKEKRRRFISSIKRVKTFRGAHKILEYANENFKTGLVTNSSKKETKKLINRFKMKKYFDIIITKEDITRPKPDPQIYLLAAKKLKVKPEECAVIEDSMFGVEAGKRAGMTVIAVTHTTEEAALIKADHVFPNLEEIKKLIKIG
jgi:HAD superfamily hydrolase (TIGR01509 family)